MNLLSIFYKKIKHITRYVTKKNRASPEIVSVLQFRAIYRQAMRPHLIKLNRLADIAHFIPSGISFYPFITSSTIQTNRVHH